MSHHLIELYKLTNVFLVLFFLFFWLGRSFAKIGSGLVLNRALLRAAQISILFAVVFPILLTVAPIRLPYIHLPAFWPKNMIQDLDGMERSPENLPPSKSNGTKIKSIPRKESVARRFSRNLPTEHSLWLFIFVLGVFLGLIRAGLGLKRLRNCLSQCTRFKKIKNVSLLISSDEAVPFASRGFSNLYIVVPCHILGSLNYLKLAIKHEIQHHRQGDTIWMFFVELLKIMFFFNPVIYLWAREIAESQELACDEALLTNQGVAAHEYGGCLIYVAESTLPKRLALFGTAGMSCGSSGPKSLLRRRIQMLCSYTRTGSRIKFGLLVFTISVGLVGAVAFASTIIVKEPVSDPTSYNPVAQTDPAMQQIAETALLAGVTSAKARAGFAVVTDVGTGQVLAAAHVKQSAGNVLVDSTQSHFLMNALPPLSVVKPLVIAEAIDKGAIKAQDIVDCGDGIYEVQGNTYKDWEAFGEISVTKIIAESSNIGAIKIANAFGGATVASLLPEFGFGSGSVALRYPHAGAGIIPSIGSMPNDLLGATIATGDRGFTVTPLEMVQAYAALANGGKLFVPLPYSQDGKSVMARQVISSDTSQVMRAILRTAVTDGTGKKAATASYTTAGKTGTSPILSTKNGPLSYVSFAGFAPVNAPRLAVYVTLENAPSGQGGTLAAPVFSHIVEPSLQSLGVTPDL